MRTLPGRQTTLVALALTAGFSAGLVLGLSMDEVAIEYHSLLLKSDPGSWWDFAGAKDGTAKRAAFERFTTRREGAAAINELLSPRGAFASVDPWFHPPRSESFEMLDPEMSAVWEVPKSRFSYAEFLLNDTACVPLTSDDAESAFHLRGLQASPASKLFLVRALFLPSGSGFSVYFQHEDLLVDHETFGTSPASMVRTALIVALPLPPRETFVDCHMDE